MSKKIFCLALAMMMLVCSTAFAAVPSKTASDVTSKYVGDTSAYAEDFVIAVAEADETAQSVLDKIAAFVNDYAVAVVKFFGEDVEEAIAALLPEGVDAADLELAELFPVNIANYDATYGDVQVAFTTLTAENTAVAVLGAVDGEDVVWTALETAVEDGDVVVTFTAEALETVTGEAVLAFLNTVD